MTERESSDSKSSDSEIIDLRECKAQANRLLPHGHPVRVALSKEPDFVPRNEGLGKLQAYIRMLYALRAVNFL